MPRRGRHNPERLHRALGQHFPDDFETKPNYNPDAESIHYLLAKPEPGQP